MLTAVALPRQRQQAEDQEEERHQSAYRQTRAREQQHGRSEQPEANVDPRQTAATASSVTPPGGLSWHPHARLP
jgi:hypothetical protein